MDDLALHQRPRTRRATQVMEPGPGQASLLSASVADVQDDQISLTMDGESTPGARRAASCLLAPVPGDTVLVSSIDGTIYILAVLERANSGDATLSVPKAETLRLRQKSIALEASDLSANVQTATISVEKTNFIGSVLTGVAETLEMVARTIKRVAGHEISHAGTAVRTVDGVESLKANTIAHDASDFLTLKSSATVIDATTDVRVNGERISLG